MDKHITILHVDDDADDRKLFSEAAMEVDEKITCVSLTNGQDALLYLRREENPLPDFIFLDLRIRTVPR